MSDARDEQSQVMEAGPPEDVTKEQQETPPVTETAPEGVLETPTEQNSEEPNVEAPPPVAPATGTRPRRNARKSVLYNNADYELQLPGMPKEEEGMSAMSSSSQLVVDETPILQKPSQKRGRAGDTVRGAKRRKGQPHLEEMMQQSQPVLRSHPEPLEQDSMISEEHIYVDDSVLQLGAETEIPHATTGEDEIPPLLNMSADYDESMQMVEDADDIPYGEEEEDYLDGRPPDLEVNLPLNKRRGRPRKDRRSGAERAAGEEVEVEEKKEKKPKATLPGKMFRVPGERVVSKSLADRQYHVKLFEDEVEMTEGGDCYATVISGCLAYLLRKERIIELLTNESEVAMIREGGWLLDKPPRLPPLVQHKACFAFYVDGSKMMSIKEVSNDDLKPWSSAGEHFGDPVIKPNVRRHPVARMNGRLQPVKGDPRLAELHLTEYSAWLPRLLRLRKKIFYLSRDGQIYGNILILYDYTCPGEAPVVMNLPHGNDYLRNAMIDGDTGMSLDDDSPGSSPFEDDIVTGPRGGWFLRVKPTKLGWAHNKKLLLKYLINEPTLLDEPNRMNCRVPFMPPLISNVGVFVYFVPASYVANQIHHTGDGLSPWTVNPAQGDAPSPRVRSTRRALTQDENGMFLLTKETGGWQQTQLCLVETMSVLARCPRLRKRVIYIQRNNSIIIGNVCYIYEYVRDGPIPTPMTKGTGPAAVGRQKMLQQDTWIEQKKELVDPNGPSTSSGRHVGATSSGDAGDEDQFIDVEDLEVVEEEVIGDVTMHEMQTVEMHHQMQPIQEQIMDDDLMDMTTEDVLNDGYDVEFDEDPLSQQENPAPYYENPRQLDTGHIYLTVRHKRVAGTFDAVLEWIANTNVVEERGLLNYAKPGHPPIVRNARAYAFFVAGTAIFPHDINRDDFSPWSHNGNAQNPTCYRTKVRKIGVICDEMGSQFQIKDVDYKTCPFHLVFLYSINPREPRLRKKIYYMMETESRLVVSHALIIYDYNQEGELPRMHGGYLKRFSKRQGKRPPLQIHDVDNDVSDMSEAEKECPFVVPPQVADDGTMYLQLIDMEFWNDRNRQLHFLVNKPSLVEALGCINNRVPALPPATTGKGAYVFFVDGLEVDARNLTCDGLVPWSENNNTNPHGTTKRPKSAKTPLALNRDGQLRVWKTPAHRGDMVEFQLHVYSATLPRCPRLRKKVTYVLKNGHQIGNAMIIYWYTEPGEMPTPVNVNAVSQEFSLQRLPPAVREDVHRLLSRMSPSEVAKIILEKYGIQVNTKMLYYVRRREIMSMSSIRGSDIHQHPDSYDIKNEMMDPSQYVEEWATGPVDPNVPSTSSAMGGKQKIVHELLDESDMQVAHTEEIEQPPVRQQDDYSQPRKMPDLHHEPRNFLHKSMATSGSIRGSQRNEALWRIAKNSFGAANEGETFDLLFKMLFEKNEQRLLQIVNQTFGVEILASEEVIDSGEMLHLAEGGEIVEEIVEEEEVVAAGPEGVDDSNSEAKVYIDGKDELEQVIVEEEVHDHLLEQALVEGVIVEDEVDPVGVEMEEHHMES